MNGPRPATRVDDVVILPGGRSRRLTRWERLRLALRLPVRVRHADHTPLLGEGIRQ